MVVVFLSVTTISQQRLWPDASMWLQSLMQRLQQRQEGQGAKLRVGRRRC